MNEEELVWNELADALLVHVISLCAKSSGARPVHVGTGILVEMAGQPFLISARHVLKDARSLFFYIDTKVTRKLSGQLLLGQLEAGTADRIDVAILRLQGPSLPPYPGVNKFCLSTNRMVRAAAVPRYEKNYLITGFPTTRTKANPHAMQLRSEAFCLIAQSSNSEKYKSLGLSEETHIVLPLDRSETIHTNGTARIFPDPHGMSGSPVWWLPDDQNGLTIPMLVGIVIEYHEDLNVVVATDIREAIKQMKMSSRGYAPQHPL